MTVPTRIEKSSLSIGKRLGGRGQGIIYEVAGGRGLPHTSHGVVFKEFISDTLRGVAWGGLDQLVAWRLGLSAADRAVVDARFTWPLAVVTDRQPVGYLMARIPPQFFQRMMLHAGPSDEPRFMSFLFTDDVLARKALGRTVGRAERVMLLQDFSYTLGWLHKRDFIYGDISDSNILFSLEPGPKVLFTDCDALRARSGQAAVPQANTPTWDPPEGAPLTMETDRYKCGLMVLRAVSPGVNAQNRSIDRMPRGALDRRGSRLLRAALAATPGSRTKAADWESYFRYIKKKRPKRPGGAPRPAPRKPPGPAPRRPARPAGVGGAPPKVPRRPAPRPAVGRNPLRKPIIPKPGPMRAAKPLAPNLHAVWVKVAKPARIVAAAVAVIALVLVGASRILSRTDANPGTSTEVASPYAWQEAFEAVRKATMSLGAEGCWIVRTLTTGAPAGSSVAEPLFSPTTFTVDFERIRSDFCDDDDLTDVRRLTVTNGVVTDNGVVKRDTYALPMPGGWAIPFSRSLDLAKREGIEPTSTGAVTWTCRQDATDPSTCWWLVTVDRGESPAIQLFISPDGAHISNRVGI